MPLANICLKILVAGHDQDVSPTNWSRKRCSTLHFRTPFKAWKRPWQCRISSRFPRTPAAYRSQSRIARAVMIRCDEWTQPRLTNVTGTDAALAWRRPMRLYVEDTFSFNRHGKASRWSLMLRGVSMALIFIDFFAEWHQMYSLYQKFGHRSVSFIRMYFVWQPG